MIIDHIATKEPIHKGWSGDKKYRITDGQGHTYLLRTTPIEHYEKKRSQFRRMQQAAQLGIPMCLPIEFGTCEEGVYSIQTWISGQEARPILPALPTARQYAYGLDAGRILQKLHSIPADNPMPWADYFNRKIDRKIAMYESCPLKYDHGQAFLDYLSGHRHLLEGRPVTYQHGDYHSGNMMIDVQGALNIIDFDKDDCGDPWEEFNRIVWSAQETPRFAAGLVDGYFDGVVPMAFWELMALYVSSNLLGSLPWAIPFGEQEVAIMQGQARDVLDWYDQFHTVVPSWYQT